MPRTIHRRDTAKNRRQDLSRGIGGVHFNPTLARQHDRKLVTLSNGARVWREPSNAQA